MKKIFLFPLLLSSGVTQVSASDSLCKLGGGAALSAAVGGAVGLGVVGLNAYSELVQDSKKNWRFGKVEGCLTLSAAVAVPVCLAGTLLNCPCSYYMPEKAALATAIIYAAGKDQERERDVYKNIKRVGGIAGASASALSMILVARTLGGVISKDDTSCIRNAHCLGLVLMTAGIVSGRVLAEKLAKKYHEEEAE